MPKPKGPSTPIWLWTKYLNGASNSRISAVNLHTLSQSSHRYTVRVQNVKHWLLSFSNQLDSLTFWVIYWFFLNSLTIPWLQKRELISNVSLISRIAGIPAKKKNWEEGSSLTSARIEGAFLNFFIELMMALAIFSASLSSQIDFFLFTTVCSRMVPFSCIAMQSVKWNDYTKFQQPKMGTYSWVKSESLFWGSNTCVI